MTTPDSNQDRPAQIDQEADRRVDREMKLRTRRSFMVMLLAAAAGYGGWRWLKTRPEDDGIPGPLRSTLRFNERISRAIFDPTKKIAEFPADQVPRNGPRVNGVIGLDTPVDAEAWRLQIEGTELSLTLADLRGLPEFSQTTPLHCIEGWTTSARWSGVRLADFTDRYFPRGRQNRYVGLNTPAGDYYVGLDAPSAYHPQTLLCYAINGVPLSAEHGAPLRLIIPTKYGVKNLKRVGKISFTDKRPPDYWAEQGYDWYAGF